MEISTYFEDENPVSNPEGEEKARLTVASHSTDEFLNLLCDRDYYSYSPKAMKWLRDQLIEIYPLETPVAAKVTEPAPPLDLTKKVITTAGEEVRILSTEASEPFPIVALVLNSGEVYRYTVKGKNVNVDAADLANYVEPPVTQVAYLNFYGTDGAFYTAGGNFSNREKADSAGVSGRRGCARVELVAGQFDA